ncbi:MAG: large extracellular alpha-helical protein [Deltaproteobacteria bacterium]|nr:large extracellular alpha-helical protein [Deltaproteobacteria bacterium]
MRISVLLALFFLSTAQAMAAFDAAEFAKNKELRILRVTPEGADVPIGRQIVIQFSRPVVPLGAMERKSADIPVTIDPMLTCQWRWLDTSALACNLDEKNEMKGATRYIVTIRPGIKTEDGATIKETVTHQFTTERPDVRDTWFRKWLSPSTPVLRLVFNQSVTLPSVQASLAIVAAEGEHNKKYAFKVEADPDDRELPAFLPLPGTKVVAVLEHTKPQKSDDDPRTVDGIEARRVWLVTPTEELPLDTAMSLMVRPGLVSALGPETGIGDREVVRFHTFPEFSFLGIKCYTNEDDDHIVLIAPGKPATPTLCNPMRGAALAFSSPVLRSQIGKHVVFQPHLMMAADGVDPWDAEGEHSSLDREHEKGRTYDIWLPGGLKAAADYALVSKEIDRGFFQKLWVWLMSWFVEVVETDLRDEFDRPLQKRLDIAFRTNHRKPNFEIVHHEAVIEGQIDSDVPLYVNNLRTTTLNYRKLSPTGATAGLSSVQQIPQVQDVQFAIPFKIRELLDGKSGAVYGFLSTDPPVNKYSGENRLFAQVTPYQLHVKLGHFNSTVWVTDLATGQPVEGAMVTVYQDSLAELSGGKTPLLQAVTSSDGVAVLAGTETLDPTLKFYNTWGDADVRLFVRVDKDGEMAVMPISHDFSVASYRVVGESVHPHNKERYGHVKTWGTTAQGIYRVGDTIQYKLYVRNQDNRELSAAPASGYTLEILDPTGNKVHEITGLTLNAFGAYAGEFVVPKQGAVGWYQFRLTADFAPQAVDRWEDREAGQEPVKGKTTWFPMRVLVSDFTPSPFKVTNQVNGDLFRAEQGVEVATHATLHSGGAYADANVRVTAMLASKPFISKNPVAKDFIFSSYEGGSDQRQVFEKMDRVDSKGAHTLSFTLPPQPIYYGRLMVESAVQDDRGKYVAAQSYADYAGVDRFVGLRAHEWIFTAGKPGQIHYLVADERGNPVAGTKVNLAIERQDTKAAKVKGAGNAYLTEFTSQWVAANLCTGDSQNASSACEFTPKEPGYYRALATITDTKGKTHSTEINMYVVGEGHVLWNEADEYSLEIVPEKPTYQVGDKARYLVKNPYPGARALVTIERYGVMDHFVRTLDGSTPVIEFEVKPDYLPGFYLSVVVFSPRVDKAIPIEGQVDLGKPTFRIGYLTVSLKDPYKEMLVTAKTDRDVYKPREKVRLTLHAEPRTKDKQEPIELAVAVLDESVFDLLTGGKSTFDPYAGFYKLEGLDLRNYSLLTRLVGRQKFEKKGANPGGDGGADLAMRNLFKFVSYWNPSITPDAAGNASVEFEVPDNLTGWRVLALAVTPSDRMGLGDVNFKVNRSTEVRPVMPNQVTEGDSFTAGFSVMNRTDTKRDLAVTLRASGDVDEQTHPTTMQTQVTLAPYQRTTVWMPLRTKAVDATRETTAGGITFQVTAADATDGDGLTHTLVVHKRRSLETAANYGTTAADTVEESILFPEKIHADVGNVSVVAAPSVIGNVAGAFEYLRDYPYPCWEQILTRGVMASHYLNLRAYMPKDFAWPGAEGLPDETLRMAASFQAPNGGMSYFVPQDQYVDPYLTAYTALAFNWLRKSGYHVPADVQNKLHEYLDTFLKQDVFPEFYDKGMASTVRAVALAALAEHNKIFMTDLERYRPHVPQMSLFGKTHFVQAAMRVPGTDTMLREVVPLILAHANQSGGKFTFSEQLDDSYSRILASPLRDNCAILSTFTALGERAEGRGLVEDIPFKLVRMVTQTRGSRTHWENTQENMFCMNGLIDYARVYENVKPNMRVTVSLDEKKFGETQFTDVKDAPVTFVRNIEATDPGRGAKATISRSGEGRLYYATRVTFAPLEEHASATNAGIELRREYSVERNGKWELLHAPAALTQSELVRVDIFLSLPAARNFVVVDDPVPGGLEPVNRDLATASIVDADKGNFAAAGGSWWFKFSDWVSYNVSRWSFYHKELRHDSARFYADYLPAGNYHLSYTAQAIAPGEFVIMPIHAEEMYDPDVYGKGVPEQLTVSQQPQQQ